MSRVHRNGFRTFSGKIFFDDFSTIFWTNIFRKNGSQVAPQAKVPSEKASYIDPLILKFSPKTEILIGNFHQNFSFLVKTCFLFLQYRKSVLKKTQIFGPNFEPCSSYVDVDSFLEQRRILGNRDPLKSNF